MFLAPAAMFAMFYFLSQYIQNVMGYSPLQGRRRVPAVHGGHRVRRRPRVQPGQPDRPALHRRASAPWSRPGALYGFSTLPFDTEFPVSRRDRDLRLRHPAVHRHDGGRHGAHVRAGHPDGRPPPAQRGLRHRVRRPQHDAAGRRRARPGRRWPRSRRRPSPTAARRSPRPARPPPRPGGPTPVRRRSWRRCRRSPSSRSSPRAPPQAFLVGSVLMLGASLVVWIFLNVKHEELATDGPEGVHVG